jgi:iron complex transport system permease protein
LSSELLHSVKRTRFLPAYKYALIPGILLLITTAGFIADILLGSIYIPASEVLSILMGKGSEQESWVKIVQLIRLPKAVTAMLAGSGLATGGLLMQTLFKNPLAGPSVLGISSGATLGVASIILAGGSVTSVYTIQKLDIGSSWLIIIAAILGAALVMGLIMALSFRVRDNVSLLIIGIMIGNLTVSMVSIWQYFSHPEQIQDYLIWTFGNLGGVTRSQLPVLAITVVTGLLLSVLIIKSLNSLLLGENYARSMGMNIVAVRMLIILITSILAGSITGFCGPIAFVGIAVPHLVRAIANSSDHRLILPATIIGGALLMIVCDIISHLPGIQFSLPINAITALLGSPVVIWIIIKQKNLRRAF